MSFFGDYHTHTIYSRRPYIFWHHAKGTIEQNILAAKEMGLKEIAITDHGFNHKYFGCSRKNLKTTKEEILRLSQKHNIKVYFGVESNFISQDGTIDVIDSDREYLDIILCGFHRSASAKTFKDLFKFTKFHFNPPQLIFLISSKILFSSKINLKVSRCSHLPSKYSFPL